MINIYSLLAQMTSENRDSVYFFLQDLILSGREAEERDLILKQIEEEFPN